MKRFTIIIAALVAMLGMPAVASAHTATVTVECKQDNVVGTFTYQNFPANSSADTALWIDGVPAKWGKATGLDNSVQKRTDSTPLPVDGKSHVVSASTRWTADGGGSAVSQNVTCISPSPTPTPTPSPTPTPTPSPTPTPTPPTTPPTPPVPPVVPPAPPTPPTPPVHKCPDTSVKRYKITVVPRNAPHGQVTFRLHGPHIRKVRWYVDLERRGVTKHHWETLSGRGDRVYRVWLFSTDVWGPGLWGEHWVTVRATVGPVGCGHSVSLKLKYFNNDPPR